MFHLAQMAAILDFTQNAMSKNTFCPHHYISGISENPWEDTQIMNHYILLKLYQLIVDFAQMAVISFQPIYRSRSQF